MKNVSKFIAAQNLINEIAKIREKLIQIDYNKSFKILPDFVECYARDRFDLKLENCIGYDATDKNGKKYQIKYTILRKDRKFTHALDNIRRDTFDFLIAVILDENLTIIKVFTIPHNVVCQYLNKDSFRIQRAIGELNRYEVSIMRIHDDP